MDVEYTVPDPSGEATTDGLGATHLRRLDRGEGYRANPTAILVQFCDFSSPRQAVKQGKCHSAAGFAILWHQTNSQTERTRYRTQGFVSRGVFISKAQSLGHVNDHEEKHSDTDYTTLCALPRMERSRENRYHRAKVFAKILTEIHEVTCLL